MIDIGIAGAAGKMGRALVRAVNEYPELKVTAAWEAPGHPALGQDAGLLAGLPVNGVKLGDSAAEGLKHCQVVLDFTAPAATCQLALAAAETGRALVVGTTGLAPDQLQVLQQAARKIALVYSTNYSMGVNLLWALAKQAAAVLGDDYDAEIIECHHNQKKDAPSGTAVTLLEAICEGKGLDPRKHARHGREGLVGARPKDEIGVHAVRAGDIVGDHTALFAGPCERLEIKHQAHSRDVLARGAARAAAWVPKQGPGLYKMAQVLGLV